MPLADNVPGLEVTRRKESHESRRDIINKQATEQLELFKSEIVKKSDNVPEDYIFLLTPLTSIPMKKTWQPQVKD